MAISDKYWEKRSIERLVVSEKTANSAIEVILPIYQDSLKKINDDIQKIYDKYSENGILDVSQLKKALTPEEKKAFLKAIEDNIALLGLDPESVYDDRYLARLTRLEALKQQIEWEIYLIALKEVEISTAAFSEIIKKTYEGIQSIIELKGVSPAFSTLDKRVLDALLRSRWVGDNYSGRIWKNTDEFARELKEIIGSALSRGESYQKTARVIRERFDVKTHEAARLVRTETNYFHNQSELQSYVDDGILEYMFDANLDGRTSEICRRLNRDIFKVKDAKPGKNYPPMHPHCRSTTQAKFPDETKPVKKYEERVGRLQLGKGAQEVASEYLKK